MNTRQTDKNNPASRSPKRISITIPYAMFEKIVERSNKEGRSLSNLAAFILEQGMEQ
jgi:hypothetical protein